MSTHDRAAKEWMVRTRLGEVLGPFTQKELTEELKKTTFSVEDEICPSQGHWVSAQALSYHDSDELTNTRTHHPFTQSITTDLPPGSSSEFTPTPEARVHLRPASTSGPVRMPAHLVAKQKRAAVSPIVWFLLVLFPLIPGMMYLKSRNQNSAAITNPMATTTAVEGESPFVRRIYNQIHAGKTQEALRTLNLYHGRGPAKNDVEYLIPYAAILILEGESSSRAKKLLEQVLESNASAALKSRAHLWLGYLALANDKIEQAESQFLEALELSPKDPAARFNLGRTYLKQEKYALALDYLQLAELEAPDPWLIQIYKGRAKFALEQPAEARAAFAAAVENSPDRWITYIYYALFLSQSQQNAEAQKVLRKMLTRDPHYEVNSPPPFGFFQERINYGEYLSAFGHVMEKVPGEEKEFGKKYIQQLLTGNEDANRLGALSEKGGLLSRVVALKVLLDKDPSALDIKKAIQRLPDNLDAFGYYAYVLRGDALSRLGLFDEAKKDFRRALDLAPTSAISRWAYATLLKKLEEGAEAQTQIRELLRYHPNYIPAIVATQNL